MERPVIIMAIKRKFSNRIKVLVNAIYEFKKIYLLSPKLYMFKVCAQLDGTSGIKSALKCTSHMPII
jgi:hypothetical protein